MSIMDNEGHGPRGLGNGAREAMLNLLAENDIVAVKDYEAAADTFLAELWMRGFKIVPLNASGTP